MNKISFVGFEYLDDWIHREVSVDVTLTITLFHHSVISSFPEPSLLKPLFETTRCCVKYPYMNYLSFKGQIQLHVYNHLVTHFSRSHESRSTSSLLY